MTTYCRITEEMEPRPERRPGLNLAAHRLSEQMSKQGEVLRIEFHDDGLIIPTIDCGVNVPGSLEAGLQVARICLADRASVALIPWPTDSRYLAIAVRTDEPLAACLGAQYAGWRIAGEGYFAMGSGPMRAAAVRRSL